VEGELRYRQFVLKKQKNGDHRIRVAEIHLSEIAKLDRAEKRNSDAPVPELAPETEAPFCGASFAFGVTAVALRLPVRINVGSFLPSLCSPSNQSSLPVEEPTLLMHCFSATVLYVVELVGEPGRTRTRNPLIDQQGDKYKGFQAVSPPCDGQK
jgi:hypothetical protein